MNDALRITDLVAHYSDEHQPVLHNISLRVARGELLAVVGPSGCGKTTLLRILAGLKQATSGTIEVDGTVIATAGVHVPPEKRHIGLVPQDAALFPHLTVAGNIGFGLRRQANRRERVAEMLKLVQLEDFADRKPSELSGGQAQRVALARALAPSPNVVLLDEPFSALDAGLRSQVRADLTEILQKAGTTAVLVTHDQDEALSIADQVALLHDGILEQIGTPTQVYNAPATAWVAQFLGECAILADGTVVRPEHVQLISTPTAMPATVTAREYLGHSTIYSVTCEDSTQLQARVLGAPAYEVGSQVFLELPDDLHVIDAAARG